MYLVQNSYPPNETRKITCILISSCTEITRQDFLLSHVTPSMQFVITDSHAKSLGPQYSAEHWVSPYLPLLLNVPFLFPSL